MSLHRLLIQFKQFLSRFRYGLHRGKRRRLIPVPLTYAVSSLLAYQHRSWGKLANTRKHRVGRRSVAIPEKQIQRIGIHVRPFIGRSHNSANLRAKVQTSLINLVVDQFDTEGIASKDQPLLSYIPNRQPKHAVEVIENVITPLFVAVNNDLRIRFGAKYVPKAFQLALEFREIIDFAVEDNPDGFLWSDIGW